MTDLPVQEPRKSRKGLALAAGGVLLAVAAVGGGVWGYNAFYGQGDQPAEALPAKGLLGYVALDLSPNGEQLVAARTTLKKFPGLADQIDLDTKDDLRKTVFEKMQQESGGCQDLDYAKDIEPWLGDRIAFAFVDKGADKEPQPLLVFQTTDADKAEAAAPALNRCLDEGAPKHVSSYAVSGDWLVLAEGEGSAKKVVDAAADGSLADDEDFQEWTDAAGDPGIATAYAAPLAATRIADFLRSEGETVPQEFDKALEEFRGAGVVARFRDGGLQIEAASDAKTAAAKGVTASGAVVAGLPASTAAAFGFGLPDGWLDTVLQEYGSVLDEETGMTGEQIEAELEKIAGITFADVETLFGDAVAVAVDAEIDPSAFEQFDPTALPVGIKIKGDTDAIEEVLDKLREAGAKQGMPRGFVVSKEAGDHVVVTINAEYADKLAEEGGLGKSETFQKLVPDADRSAVTFFLDFDAQDWLESLLEDFDAPKDIRDNVAPLSGIGASSWLDGDVGHSLFTITTD